MANTGVERFGEYELVRYLAAGGMADLYLARSPHWRELLVVKRIQPRYLDHTRVVKMFIDEGRIVQILQHANIVRVLDVGSVGPTHYIAMEYIPGHDLIALVRRGVETGQFVPRHLAVAIVAQVATGLAFAHTRTDEEGNSLHIVHCDISPGNVVVSLRGTAKIVDFGIARATIALREEESIAGKYNYMAPEQIRGQPVDERADLFALGVILWELTVGKRLFKGAPPVVMRLVCEDPIPRPSEVRPDFPPDLERIIMRLLERDLDKRLSSAMELRAELRGWLARCPDSTSKRDLARYLHELFRAPRQTVADEEALQDIEDEELELERAMPEVEPHLEVDPDDEDELDLALVVGPTAVSTPWGIPSLGLKPSLGEFGDDITPLPPPSPAPPPPLVEQQTERFPLLEEDELAESQPAAPLAAILDDRTESVIPLPKPRVPPPKPVVRRPRVPVRRSSGPELVVGVTMLVLAGLLLVLYFFVNR